MYSRTIDAALQIFSNAVEENTNILTRKSRGNDSIRSLVEKFTSESTSSRGGQTHDGVKPAVRPWDREDLLQRLKTFSSAKWFAKPEIISPSVCARFGWTNSAPDVLLCLNCGESLVHDTVVDYTGTSLSLSLSSAHSSRCGWRNNTCPLHTLTPSPTTLTQLLLQYTERYLSLSSLLQHCEDIGQERERERGIEEREREREKDLLNNLCVQLPTEWMTYWVLILFINILGGVPGSSLYSVLRPRERERKRERNRERDRTSSYVVGK